MTVTAHPSPITAHGSLPASLVTARRAARHALWVATGRPGALVTAYLVHYIDVEPGASRTPLETAWHWALAGLAEDRRQAACNTFGLLAPYTWLTQDGLI